MRTPSVTTTTPMIPEKSALDEIPSSNRSKEPPQKDHVEGNVPQSQITNNPITMDAIKPALELHPIVYGGSGRPQPCEACRKGRKRCDLTRPSCSYCLKRGIPCSWEPAPVKLRIPKKMAVEPDAVMAQLTQNPGDMIPGAVAESCRKVMSIQSLLVDSDCEETNSKKRHSTRPPPCEGCRKQRKKCDRLSPVCSYCTLRGSRCHYGDGSEGAIATPEHVRFVKLLQRRQLHGAALRNGHDAAVKLPAANSACSQTNSTPDEYHYSYAAASFPAVHFSSHLHSQPMYPYSKPYLHEWNHIYSNHHHSVRNTFGPAHDSYYYSGNHRHNHRSSDIPMNVEEYSLRPPLLESRSPSLEMEGAVEARCSSG
ncbi:hypothetical protein BDR26DRAFT_850927 [Obelidium mucronatum]|nr:hypothetical protein BDR26DRAFT_850927 [Obelidium mucronatum]